MKRLFAEELHTCAAETPIFTYSRWRHGGWYVHGVRYPSGAVGCVSKNYPDGKWRIVCDPRAFEKRATFNTRGEAAMAEWKLAHIASTNADRED